MEEQAQDKRPLKVKLASWFWTVWDENLDARVESSRFFLQYLENTHLMLKHGGGV